MVTVVVVAFFLFDFFSSRIWGLFLTWTLAKMNIFWRCCGRWWAACGWIMPQISWGRVIHPWPSKEPWNFPKSQDFLKRTKTKINNIYNVQSSLCDFMGFLGVSWCNNMLLANWTAWIKCNVTSDVASSCLWIPRFLPWTSMDELFPPWKLIYPLQIDGWKMTSPLEMVPFQWTLVHFWGGTCTIICWLVFW